MSEFWTPQDDNRLFFYAGVEPPAAIAARLGRTERSIIVRYRRDHGRTFTAATFRHGGLSVTECAQALGVYRRQVHDWIRRRWLRARKRHVISDYVYTVQEEDFEQFIVTIGGLLPKLQPSPEWIDSIAQARHALRVRYIDRTGIADALCLSPSRIGDIPTFPAPALVLPRYWYERAAVREWLATAPPHYRTSSALRAFGLGRERPAGLGRRGAR